MPEQNRAVGTSDITRATVSSSGTVTITALSVFNAAHFECFAPPSYWSAFKSRGFSRPFIAFGALCDEQPIGVALGRVQLDGSGRLLALYVQRDFRRRGTGASLVRSLERALADCRCKSVEARYDLGTEATPAVERTLQQCGWPMPGGRRHSFALDGRIMSASWFRNAVLPADYRVAPWHTVTPTERAALIDSQLTDPWIPEPLHPWQCEAELDPATSLVLRRIGAVIGWTQTRVIDPQTVHYANVYVRPSCNRVGKTFASLALIAEAVRRQTAERGIRSRGLFEVSADNRAFLRFIERHFASDLLSSHVTQRLVKPL